MDNNVKQINWLWEHKHQAKWWNWQMRDVWNYRNLLFRLVRREMLIKHQQTLLGPLWMLAQPIITMFTYLLVFNKMVGISTGGTPPILFYLIGIVLWTLFSDCFVNVSQTYIQFGSVFKKVYFPRLIVPLSIAHSQLIRFLMQMGLFFLFAFVYWIIYQVPIHFNEWMMLFPFAIILIVINGFSAGLILAILTAEYRDLIILVQLGVRLLMFITPVIYPVSLVSAKVRWVAELNPLTSLFELCRFAVLGEGTFTVLQLLYGAFASLLLLVFAMVLFTKHGDKLIDII